MSVSFSFPLALLLLGLVPGYFWVRRSGERALPIPRITELRRLRGRRAWLAAIPELLRAFVLVCLILAMAGPAAAGSVIEQPREGVPIVLAIDISSSMLAQDFRPRDRLAVAKATIARFIAARENDPIGLVAFAAEALTLVPTTTHRNVLLSALESLQVGLLEDGTAIGDGLATSLNRLRPASQRASGEAFGDGVVILLSDGESNRGTIDPVAAADAAAALGLRVFTVGVGSEGVAPVPVGSAPAGFRYAELPVGLDEELLRTLAERTGGRYFRATDPEALERIYAEIDRLVPSVVETTRYVETIALALPLLLLAGAFLVVEWSIRASRWGTLP